MIKAVVFDLYGTLVDIKTDEDKDILWQAFSKYTDYQAGELKALYLSEVNKLERQLVEGAEIELETVFESLNISKKLMYKFRELSREKLKLYDGVRELLDYLKAQGIRRILLSNAQSIFTRPEIELLDLSKDLDSFYLSSDIGYKKPSPKFFSYMLKAEGLKAENCIFVGNDSKCDIEGAENMGMRAVYIHTDCSPDLHKPLQCFTAMDGDFKKITEYLKQII